MLFFDFAENRVKSAIRVKFTTGFCENCVMNSLIFMVGRRKKKVEKRRGRAALQDPAEFLCARIFSGSSGRVSVLDCGMTVPLYQPFNGRSPSLDPGWKPGDSGFVRLMGAYWFRPGECARGGMPRMVRWPRKKSNQKSKANQELALAA